MRIPDILMLIITIIIGLLTIVEKSKIVKFHPISWLFGNEEMRKKINNINDTVFILSQKIDELGICELEHYRKQAKLFISSFATDLRRAKKENINPLDIKSETEFISIVDLCNEYCNKNWNSKVKHDAEYIKQVYEMLDK